MLAIYLDASSTINSNRIGVGLAAYNYAQNAAEIYSETINIGKEQIVYNGELEGIARSFEYAATVAEKDQEIRIHANN